MNNINKENLLEAILFSESEPISLSRICELMGTEESHTLVILGNLEKTLENRGIVLIQSTEGFALGTHPDASSVIEKIRKDELTRELSKSAVETLSVILYSENVSKSDIDFVRGVNSGFILRNLSIRGLVERTVDTKDSRRFIYKPTIQLLQSLGITKSSDMEEYEEIKNSLLGRINDQTQNDQ